MMFGFMAVFYAGFMTDGPEASTRKMAMMIVFLSTFVMYLWLWCNANSKGTAPVAILGMHRLAVVGVLLYHSEVIDFGVLNLVFRLMAGSLLLGVLSPNTGAAGAGVSTLVLYKVAADYVWTVPHGPLLWQLAWGVITIFSSFGWLFLFYYDYDDKQKIRVLNTAWQDRILGVFCFAVSAALEKAGHLKQGTVGEPVIYLLPIVTMWFTLETKMLNHKRVGTPFHPTWYHYGDLPEFSKSDWDNVTFGIATALITVVLTSYAFYAVTVALGGARANLMLDNPSIYKFALAHGILFIFHSGMWMIVASSGVPPIGDAKAFRMFPPEIPASQIPIRCDPKHCVFCHKFDLAAGQVFLLLGSFFLDDVMTSEESKLLVKGMVCAAWAYTATAKLYFHWKDFGYEPKVEHRLKAKSD